MTRFNTRFGAAVLVVLGVLYAALALATGHSAQAEPPVDLRATSPGIDAWQALRLMASSQVAVVDVRESDRFASFHLPGAVNLSGADADAVVSAVDDRHPVLVIADQDEQASELVAELARRRPHADQHFLAGGVRTWYLAMELPVELFSSKPVPYGYREAMATLRRWLYEGTKPTDAVLDQAIGRLAGLAFQPDQLAGKSKPEASGKKKKILGGCE
jgi:rhodanese-related sulfurtransferase